MLQQNRKNSILLVRVESENFISAAAGVPTVHSRPEFRLMLKGHTPRQEAEVLGTLKSLQSFEQLGFRV